MVISKQENCAIVDWLNGKVKKNSAEERMARRALSRAMLLGEHLPKAVRRLLSERFDPDEGDVALALVKPSRTRGRPKVKARNWEIAEIVEREIRAGVKKQAALMLAADKFGISQRTAEKAHAECKEQIRALGPSARIITSFDK